jgi:hypothetical protein
LRRSPFVVLLAATAFAACTHRERTIPRGKFVAASVALRMINDSGPHADTLRAAALKRAGVSAADLRRFVAVNANRTAVLAKAWDEIDDSVQKRIAPPSIPYPEPAPSVARPGAPRGAPRPPVHFPPAQLQVERSVQDAPRAALPAAPPPVVSGPPPARRTPPVRRGLPPRSRPIRKMTPPPGSAFEDGAPHTP